MARLSTGQTYGEASRATAAQLLGGIPVDASMGALAQSSIGTPSLQPKAAPVETFQRVGAPTLGGAPQFFAPPKLPDPGQDLANLARSLGGFSSTLQSFGETFLANKQEQEKRKEAASAAFVGQTTKYGPARGMADLAANLEKATALGDTQAAKHLQYVKEQMNSSYGRYFLERSIEQNAISSAALSLPDQIAATATIQVDGKEVDFKSLPTTDPRYLAHVDKLLFGGVQMTTQGYAKNQQLILQATLQANEVHRKQYNEDQDTKQSAQRTVNRYATASNFVVKFQAGQGEQARIEFIKSATRDLEAIRSSSSSPESKKKDTNGYIESLVLDTVAALKRNSVSRDEIMSFDLRQELGPVLRFLFTGPIETRIKADGKPNEAQRLYNALGGEAYLDQVFAKGQAAQIQDYNQQGQVASIQAQQSYNTRRMQAEKDGTFKDPARTTAFIERERLAAQAIPGYQDRTALLGVIDAEEKNLTEAVIKPRQEETAAKIASLMVGTEKDEAARNRLSADLDIKLRRKEISVADYEKYKLAIAAQGNKDVRSYDKDIKDRMDRALKDWDAKSKSSNSYNGTSTVGYEDNARWKASSLMLTKSREVVVQALKEGRDPIEALNKTWATNNWGLRDYKDVVGSQPTVYKSSTELINSNTGWFSRNAIGGQAANNLRGAATKRRLYEKQPFGADVDLYLKGQPTENFKTLLKAIGGPPSRFILRQFQLHGVDLRDLDPAFVDQIKSMDGQKISMAAPRRRPTPQQNNALNGIQIATGAVSRVLNPVQALGNALTPAAQAQTAPQALNMSMFYADPGPNPKATQVAMAPPPPRAKPKPATSQSGSMTGLATYYTGSGGSDGVVGAMTANNRDRFNPNAMTVAVQKSLRGKYLNKWLIVEDAGTGKSVRVFANDVGSMGGTDKSINRQDPRIVDLSPAAFKQLFGGLGRGVGRIRVRIDSNQQGQSPSRVR
jgi:rare lipoprotein A (peptidoglycan hydrolase)